MRLSLLALTVLAGTAARDLPVPPGKGWKHAETGVILTAALDGLPRTRIGDATASEHDVYAEFAAPDRGVIATVYIFHPAVDDVTMWFERARIQIQDRDVYGGVEALSAEPIAFVPPGASGAPTALRQTFRPTRNYTSTSLAAVPVGDWLVTVRLSATRLDPAALDAELTRILAAIRWPRPLPAAPALHAIGACPTPLAFEKAKVVRSSGKDAGADLLMTLVSGSVAHDAKPAEPPKRIDWCRDPATDMVAGVYRPIDGSKGYLLALRDAGRTVGVWPSLGGQIGLAGAGTYAVTLTDVDDRTSVYPSFDRLPSPAQVLKLLDGPVRGTTTRGRNGKQDITLDPKAL